MATWVIVFADNPNVVSLWHKYYALLSRPPSEERVHTWLELLIEMALVLDYKLKQTDLDKFFMPQVHADQIEHQTKVQKELLRILENTDHFLVKIKEENNNHNPSCHLSGDEDRIRNMIFQAAN